MLSLEDHAYSVCCLLVHISNWLCTLLYPRAAENTEIVLLIASAFQLCQQNNWCTLRLDGSLSVKQRQPLVDRFNNPTDPSFVGLIMC